MIENNWDSVALSQLFSVGVLLFPGGWMLLCASLEKELNGFLTD